LKFKELFKSSSNKLTLSCVFLLVAFAFNSNAEQQVPQKFDSGKQPTEALILNFMQAFEAVYQPNMTENELDKYFDFMTTDLIDYHMAYNVMKSGLEGINKSREGLLKKAKNSIHYKLNVESIIIGTSTAVVVYLEDAKYVKIKKLQGQNNRSFRV